MVHKIGAVETFFSYLLLEPDRYNDYRRPMQKLFEILIICIFQGVFNAFFLVVPLTFINLESKDGQNEIFDSINIYNGKF